MSSSTTVQPLPAPAPFSLPQISTSSPPSSDLLLLRLVFDNHSFPSPNVSNSSSFSSSNSNSNSNIPSLLSPSSSSSQATQSATTSGRSSFSSRPTSPRLIPASSSPALPFASPLIASTSSSSSSSTASASSTPPLSSVTGSGLSRSYTSAPRLSTISSGRDGIVYNEEQYYDPSPTGGGGGKRRSNPQHSSPASAVTSSASSSASSSALVSPTFYNRLQSLVDFGSIQLPPPPSSPFLITATANLSPAPLSSPPLLTSSFNPSFDSATTLNESTGLGKERQSSNVTSALSKSLQSPTTTISLLGFSLATLRSILFSTFNRSVCSSLLSSSRLTPSQSRFLLSGRFVFIHSLTGQVIDVQKEAVTSVYAMLPTLMLRGVAAQQRTSRDGSSSLGGMGIGLPTSTLLLPHDSSNVTNNAASASAASQHGSYGSESVFPLPSYHSPLIRSATTANYSSDVDFNSSGSGGTTEANSGTTSPSLTSLPAPASGAQRNPITFSLGGAGWTGSLQTSPRKIAGAGDGGDEHRGKKRHSPTPGPTTAPSSARRLQSAGAVLATSKSEISPSSSSTLLSHAATTGRSYRSLDSSISPTNASSHATTSSLRPSSSTTSPPSLPASSSAVSASSTVTSDLDKAAALKWLRDAPRSASLEYRSLSTGSATLPSTMNRRKGQHDRMFHGAGRAQEGDSLVATSGVGIRKRAEEGIEMKQEYQQQQQQQQQQQYHVGGISTSSIATRTDIAMGMGGRSNISREQQSQQSQQTQQHPRSFSDTTPSSSSSSPIPPPPPFRRRPSIHFEDLLSEFVSVPSSSSILPHRITVIGDRDRVKSIEEKEAEKLREEEEEVARKKTPSEWEKHVTGRIQTAARRAPSTLLIGNCSVYTNLTAFLASRMDEKRISKHPTAVVRRRKKGRAKREKQRAKKNVKQNENEEKETEKEKVRELTEEEGEGLFNIKEEDKKSPQDIERNREQEAREQQVLSNLVQLLSPPSLPSSTTSSPAASITPSPSPTPPSPTSASSPSSVLDSSDRAPLWISVEDASDEVIAIIGEHFGLHPLTIEDCESSGIREKLEVFPDYLFVVFHALDSTASNSSFAISPAVLNPIPSLSYPITVEVMKTTPIKLVVFPHCVLTFHKSGLSAISIVRQQLYKLYHNRLENSAWLIHALLDSVSDSLMPVVKLACTSADSLEDLVYTISGQSGKHHKELLRSMGLISRRLGFLRQRLWSKRDILLSLIEKDWAMFLEGVKIPYLRDVYDHVVIMLHSLDQALEIVDTTQSTYLSIVQIDVAAAANAGNRVMKQLSAAATIVLPLSLIAGMFGMNIRVPFQSDFDWHEFPFDLIPFWMTCFTFIFIVWGLYQYFKSKNYIA